MNLDLVEIQYLRGLVVADQLEKDYENDLEHKIAQNKSMFDFSNEVLDSLEVQEHKIYRPHITKEEYILTRIKGMAIRKAESSEKIKPLSLLNLIEQWEFDYEMDRLRYLKEVKK